MSSQITRATDPTPLELGHQAAGIAAANADRQVADWTERAFRFLCKFAKSHPSFMAEDVRLEAEKAPGYVAPPDGRAWGAVILRARRAGLLVHIGYAPMKSRNCHGNPKSVWRWIGG